MDNQEAIRRFLLGEMGYARIQEYFAMPIGERPKIRQHLEGTIIGTFRTKHTKLTQKLLKPGENPRDYNFRFIRIPKIYARAEYDKTNSEKITDNLGETYLDRYKGEIDIRSYFLCSMLGFERITGNQVKERVRAIHQRLFSDADYIHDTNGGSFSAGIVSPDFYFGVKGTVNRISWKSIVAAFNVDPQTVEEINYIARRYNGMMKAIKEANR